MVIAIRIWEYLYVTPGRYPQRGDLLMQLSNLRRQRGDLVCLELVGIAELQMHLCQLVEPGLEVFGVVDFTLTERALGVAVLCTTSL